MFPVSYLPYNDGGGDVRYRSIPWGTLGLIVTNTLIFMFVWKLGWFEMYLRWRIFGSVSDHILEGWGMPAFSVIGSMFLHGDIFHLFFNMLYLWTFGRRVEDACGTARFLVYYISAGIVADIVPLLAYDLGLTNDGFTPGIGASGAISGIMGAYLILFPGTRISGFFSLNITFCPVPIPYRVRLPAALPLLFFLAQQIYFSYETVTNPELFYGVNFLAHLGGFMGALLVFLYLRKDVFYRYWSTADL